MPESVAPNIRGRSYTIAAELDVDTTDAGGVLFEQGSRFGGHALYVKDGKLNYVYNIVGELVQTIESDETIPTGHVVVSATFTKERARCRRRDRSPCTSETAKSAKATSGPSQENSTSPGPGS